jgi:hypothetical protein
MKQLKQKMRSKEETSSSEFDKLRVEMEAEARKLREEMLLAADDYSRKIKWMENNQKEEIRRLQEKQQHELEYLQNDLKRKHMEEISAQLTAHRVTVESVQDQAEKKRLLDLGGLAEKHKKEKGMSGMAIIDVMQISCRGQLEFCIGYFLYFVSGKNQSRICVAGEGKPAT